MASSSPPAGGALVALGAIFGTVIGFLFGQATIGFLIGIAAGILAAIVIWRRDMDH